jgi:hypothetical protein
MNEDSSKHRQEIEAVFRSATFGKWRRDKQKARLTPAGPFVF